MRKHRLTLLEKQLQAAAGCPECGWGSPGEVEIEIYWPDIDGELAPEGFEDFPEETTYCETCGSPVDIVIKWNDLEEEEFDPLRSEKLRQHRKDPDEV